MANFWDLRDANVARDIEWTGGSTPVSFTFRAAELAGECGEVGDLFVQGQPTGAQHEAEWHAALTEELADGFICVDLIGFKLGFPTIPHDEPFHPDFVEHYDKFSNMELLALLGVMNGRICNLMKKLERAANGWVGSKADSYDVWEPLFTVHSILRMLAERYSVPVPEAVSTKFNKTSEKNGLTTRLLA